MVIIAAFIVIQTGFLQNRAQGSIKIENDTISVEVSADAAGEKKDYIKWVDFSISYEALCSAYDWDVETHGTEHAIDWIELLAYTAAKTGGSFDKKALTTLNKAAQQICDGKTTMEKLTGDLKYYPYYKEAYEAALGGMVGEYDVSYIF